MTIIYGQLTMYYMGDKKAELEQLLGGSVPPDNSRMVTPGSITPSVPLPPVAVEPSQIKEITGSTVKELAESAAPEAFKELYRIAVGFDEDVTPGIRVAAIKEILDRGLGKAAQNVDVNVKHSAIIQRIQLGRGKTLPTIDAEVEEVE